MHRNEYHNNAQLINLYENKWKFKRGGGLVSEVRDRGLLTSTSAESTPRSV